MLSMVSPDPVDHRPDGAPVYLVRQGDAVRRMVKVRGELVPVAAASPAWGRGALAIAAIGAAGVVAAPFGLPATLGTLLVATIAASMAAR